MSLFKEVMGDCWFIVIHWCQSWRGLKIDASRVSQELGRSSHTERRDNQWHRPVTWWPCERSKVEVVKERSLVYWYIINPKIYIYRSKTILLYIYYIYIIIQEKIRFVESQCLTCFASVWHFLARMESSNLSFVIRIDFWSWCHTSKVLQVSFIRWTTVQTASITSWLQRILSLPYCRGLQKRGRISHQVIKATLNLWSMSPSDSESSTESRIPAPPSRMRTEVSLW